MDWAINMTSRSPDMKHLFISLAIILCLLPAEGLYAKSDNPIVSLFESIVNFFGDNFKKSAQSIENMFSLNCVVAFDVSGSMQAYFQNVKQNTDEFIQLFSEKDNLIFATFHESVDILHNGPATKSSLYALRNKISQSQALGAWTDIEQAVNSAKTLLSGMEKEYPGRVPILVFVSDGIDDPNPYSVKREKRNLGSYARSMAFGKGWQVYDIGDGNFGDGLKTDEQRRTAINRLDVTSSISTRITVSYILNIFFLVLFIILLIVLFRLARKKFPKAARFGLIVSILLCGLFLHHVLSLVQWVAAVIISIF